MTVDELKSLLGHFNIRPDKRLGQNFLLSEEVLDKIVGAAQLSKDDTVLEIGPGLGFLTKRLAERAGEVIAIEKDRKLARVLRKIFSTPSYISPLSRGRKRGGGNVKIIEGDALHLSPSVIPAFEPESNSIDDVLDSRLRGNDNKGSYKFVANIPYYLTGKILEKFLSSSVIASEPPGERGNPKDRLSPDPGRGPRNDRPDLMVFLLQKEVAERIIAKPGDMSVLAVSVQFYSDPEIIEIVPKENFYPMPEVDSAIVRLTPPLIPPLTKGGREGGFRPRYNNVDEKKFFQLVKIGFSNRRKQLHNNLQALRPLSQPPPERSRRTGLPINWGEEFPSPKHGEGLRERFDFKNILTSIGLNPLARAQDLSLEDWKKLYDQYIQ